MLILDKLWDGELYPAERSMGGWPAYSRCMREVSQASEALREKLSTEESQCFEVYREKSMEMGELLQQDAFFTGFRMAGLLLLDILAGAETR